MTKLPINYHPAARAEADAAFEWYFDRSWGAAARFQSELETAQNGSKHIRTRGLSIFTGRGDIS